MLHWELVVNASEMRHTTEKGLKTRYLRAKVVGRQSIWQTIVFNGGVYPF